MKPGKRKSPGADVSYPSTPLTTSIPPRRAISQPAALLPPVEHNISQRLSTTLFRRKTLRDAEQLSATDSAATQSRGSSLSRHGRQPSGAVTGDGSAERDESRPRSSWLRRISAIPSSHGSSPAPSILKMEVDLHVNSLRSQEDEMPNKLVKRSTSQRGLSITEAKGSFFRRPATSHRRSASQIPTSTPQQMTPAPSIPAQTPPLVPTAPSWRPYFESAYPRKRHTSDTTRDTPIRTVSVPYLRRPTLVHAQNVQRQEPHDDIDERRPWTSPDPPPAPAPAPVYRRQGLRRSLTNFRKNGRQRNFTDPTVRVFKEDVQGSILPTARQSPLSPVSRSSTFNFEVPHGTPVFASSPPMQQITHPTISAHKRVSAAQSDMNTTSSDNDTRVFTDDDSMDFQSDSAYDSLATRATASSHSGYRQPKIETIFDEPVSENGELGRTSLEDLMLRSTLNEQGQAMSARTPAWAEAVGMGITGLPDEHAKPDMHADRAATPIRSSALSSIEELTATPVSLGQRARLIDIPSSSPPSVLRHPMPPPRVPRVNYPEDMDIDRDDSIDWSPKSTRDSASPSSLLPSNQTTSCSEQQLSTPQPPDSSKRSSIFDWSEQKEAANGFGPRPRTVHGKHANEANRSRASGRKSTNTTHLRSQSVPVNREVVEKDTTTAAASKFGTWGLGNKPVSEEWSDDFEFDDMEEPKEFRPVELPVQANQRDSMRSVKVPQNILDRQASVHVQFGQVQEFMVLVEDLKRLRTQGATLELLDGQSKQLWDDAENIINLATLNDEEDGPLRPPSPISDIFGEDNSPQSRRISHDEKRDSFARRSISNPATPPYGRPRGESLMQAKSFLQTMHQIRAADSSPAAPPVSPPREKLPFDTQDLRDLVTRAGVITRALKEIVRKAEGVAVSPQRTPQKVYDPTFSHIFNPPEISPCPPFRNPGLPKSRSANSYLGAPVGNNENELSSPLKFPAVVEAN